MTTAVAVVGIGEMGGALARALLRAGYRVTVWNRTSDKCLPLAEAGAVVAGTVVEAAVASDCVIVCLSDYAAVQATVCTPEVARALRGKILVQLTTRSPRSAREGKIWADSVGVGLLEGAIQGYPVHIGTREGAVLYAGEQAVFERIRPVLLALGGQPVHVGEAIGSAAALDLAMAGTVVPGLVLAFLQGAAVCEAEGAPLDLYLNLVEQHAIPGLAMATLRASISMIERRQYAYTGEGAPLGVWMHGLEMTVEAMKASGVDPRFAAAGLGFLREAATKGSERDEMPVVFEVFRRR